MLLFIEMNPILYTELILWFVSIVFLALNGILFVKDYKKFDNSYFLFISLFFFIYILGRLTRLWVRFVIGEPPLGQSLEGDAFIIESISTIFGMLGLFFVFYAVEKTTIKKSHYIFSIITWITTILAIIDLIVRILTLLTFALFIAIGLAPSLIFFYLAAKSNGVVRRNSLFVSIGCLLFLFGVGFDIPEGKLVFSFMTLDLLSILAPICQITGCILLRIGFQKKL